MEPAVPGLREALAAARFREPRFPVIANASATPVQSAREAVARLAEQLTAPVRWVDCIRTALELDPAASFVEIGPGTVLAGLVKRIAPEAGCLSLGTAAEVEQFLA
jgi:[acyl-carrier-protein] S-malonyltransferase